jgi:hypothetical protein
LNIEFKDFTLILVFSFNNNNPKFSCSPPLLVDHNMQEKGIMGRWVWYIRVGVGQKISAVKKRMYLTDGKELDHEF